MAIIENPKELKSGREGDLVFWVVNGKQIVSFRPKKDRKRKKKAVPDKGTGAVAKPTVPRPKPVKKRVVATRPEDADLIILRLPVLGMISGRMGDRVYRVKNGKQIVAKLPKKPTKPPTEKELQHRALFKEAITWAKEELGKPVPGGRKVRKKIPGLSLFNVLVKEYMARKKKERGKG